MKIGSSCLEVVVANPGGTRMGLTIATECWFLDALGTLGGKPIETRTAVEARR